MSKQVPRNVEAEGARLLRVYRAANRLSQADFALLIGAGATQISEYENGSTPGLPNAVLIEHVTGGAVPAVSWVDPLSIAKFREQLVEQNANSDQASAVRPSRRRKDIAA